MKAVLAFLCISLVLLGVSAADTDAPLLDFLEVPDIPRNDVTGSYVSFNARDETAVKYVKVELWDAENNVVAFAAWNASASVKQTVDADVNITFLVDPEDLSAWYYPLTVTLCDTLENCDTYSSQDLEASGYAPQTAVFFTDVIINCPTEPLDVGTDAVSFTCTLSIQSSPHPIIFYNVEASLTYGEGEEDVYSVAPENGVFDDTESEEAEILVDIVFNLAKYAPNGTYVVSVSAASSNYIYTDVKTQFVVAASINDLSAPKLIGLDAPAVVIGGDEEVVVHMDITDDAVGVSYVELEIHGFGTGRWDTNTPEIGEDTNIRISIYPTTPEKLVRKVYDISVTLCDKTEKCVSWTASQLYTAGYTPSLNVGPVDFSKNGAEISCGGPYDVAAGPVTVECLYKINWYTGIYTYTVLGARDAKEGEVTWTAQAGYYHDEKGDQTEIEAKHIFTLPRYAPYGNYTVTATAYDQDNVGSLVATYVFVVKQTTNDMAPPALKAISVPQQRDVTKFIAWLSATDDTSGIAFIRVRLYAFGATGEGKTNTSHSPSAAINNIEIPIVMNVYNQSNSEVFAIEVELTDVLAHSRTYSSRELGELGFQANVTTGEPIPSSTTGKATTATTTPTSTGSSEDITDAGVRTQVSLQLLLLAFVCILVVNIL